jgi:hypothetical protein
LQAYLGALDNRSSRQAIISGNLLLLQVQALLISALAGCFSFVLSWIMKKIEGKGESKSALLARRALSRLENGLNDGSVSVKGESRGKKNRKKPSANPGFSE